MGRASLGSDICATICWVMRNGLDGTGMVVETGGLCTGKEEGRVTEQDELREALVGNSKSTGRPSKEEGDEIDLIFMGISAGLSVPEPAIAGTQSPLRGCDQRVEFCHLITVVTS